MFFYMYMYIYKYLRIVMFFQQVDGKPSAGPPSPGWLNFGGRYSEVGCLLGYCVGW